MLKYSCRKAGKDRGPGGRGLLTTLKHVASVKKQEKVASQMVMLVDENDQFLGTYALRYKAHSGRGLHHRAFVCLIVDGNGRVLLQKRKHWMWDNLWDVSAISHTLHLKDHDESYEEAAARGLLKEMGIQGVPTVKVGGFNYFAEHPGDKKCENEYCAILIGRYDGMVRPSEEEVYAYKWVRLDDFLKSVKRNRRVYTPWTRLAAETLEKQKKLPFLRELCMVPRKARTQIAATNRRAR